MEKGVRCTHQKQMLHEQRWPRLLLHLQLYLVSQWRRSSKSRSRLLSKWWLPKSSEEEYTDEEQAAFTERGQPMFWFNWDTVKHKIIIELVEVEDNALLDRVNPTRMYFDGEHI